MISENSLIKISDFIWEIPETYRSDMLVPARFFTSNNLLKDTLSDRSLEQLINVACLPGIQRYALAMPDMHEGYGFPIGGVAATEYPDGVISPGGIGYDINCGVRLLISNLKINDIKIYLSDLAQKIFEEVPAGVGVPGRLKLDNKMMDNVLNKGVKWLDSQGYTQQKDTDRIESNGFLNNADATYISNHAKERGKYQLGTMGAGNHFVEIDYVAEIFDEKIAHAFGLFIDQVTILIHTGSRGLGHQVATDYIRKMINVLPKYKINLPDRELACVPFSSNEGQAYFKAMSGAANFAFANRQLITWEVRNAWSQVLGKMGGQLSILYDVAHNIAKIEEYQIENTLKKVIVHRKGATRAFAPGSAELTEEYKITGQPVLIPGSMGTSSYVLAGTIEAMKQTFGSTCHGAGRRMSRHAAKRKMSGPELQKELRKEEIEILSKNIRDLAEEGPFAYKDINEVVEVVQQAGIAKKIAKLKPVAVIKG